MKIIKSIDHKRLQSSFYEKLFHILRYFNLFIEKKLFNFYTNIVGTIPLIICSNMDIVHKPFAKNYRSILRIKCVITGPVSPKKYITTQKRKYPHTPTNKQIKIPPTSTITIFYDTIYQNNSLSQSNGRFSVQAVDSDSVRHYPCQTKAVAGLTQH